MKKKLIFLIAVLLSVANASNFNGSAQYGSAHSEYSLATQYKNKAQTRQDLTQAFNLYHKSATKGYSYAQYELALMFHYGSGVRQNSELAKLWFRRASRQGHAQARSILYRFYSERRVIISYRR